MNPETYSNRRQRGFSLIELLVVIIIIGIVASFAFMLGDPANERFRRQNVSHQLKAAFERARFDSVKRRAGDSTPDLRAYVQVRPNGFTLRTYKQNSGVWDLADDQIYDAPPGIIIAASGRVDTLPKTVVFNQRGEASVLNGGDADFSVCNQNCATAGAAGKDTILVSLTGTVNLLLSGTAPEFLTPPGPSGIPVTSGVNPDAIIP